MLQPPDSTTEAGVLLRPKPRCATCRHLAAQHAAAERARDASASTDACVLMRRHHAAAHQ
ncbi:hypothetical protein [Kitasatospora sp. NPDC056184]|uniref:hypothetical protein n=1 Tax=Kitasatospora sp. NPDC056184 TaxID=3345738 RepID=UPI0035DF914D